MVFLVCLFLILFFKSVSKIKVESPDSPTQTKWLKLGSVSSLELFWPYLALVSHNESAAVLCEHSFKAHQPSFLMRITSDRCQ